MNYPIRANVHRFVKNLISYLLAITFSIQNVVSASGESYLHPPSFFKDDSSALLEYALGKSLESVLDGKPFVFDPVFDKFIKKHKNGEFAGHIDLGSMEIIIFVKNWLEGKYPSIEECDLGRVIEKIINKWMNLYRQRSVKKLREKGIPITSNYSVWHNPCWVKAVVSKKGESYISFSFLGWPLGLTIYTERRTKGDGGPISLYDDFKGIEDEEYDNFLMNKLKTIKGDIKWKDTLSNPDCRDCLQEMIDGLGWERMAQVLFQKRDILGATEEELSEFLQELGKEIFNDAKEFVKSKDVRDLLDKNKDGIDPVFGSLKFNEQMNRYWQEWREKHKDSIHIDSSNMAYILGNADAPDNYLFLMPGQGLFKGAYPSTKVKKGDEETILPMRMSGLLKSDLAEEAILILEETAGKHQRLGDALIKNLIERIRKGKVFFGEGFLRSAAAVEFKAGDKSDYCIVLNRYMEKGLDIDPRTQDKRSLRGLFLASILLGQEAQIYMRRNNHTNWDDPEYNAAFIAQAAELQLLAFYRDAPNFLFQYNLFIASLISNIWGEANLRDLVDIHANVLKRGIDYQFLEHKIGMFLSYRTYLASAALIQYSQESLQSVNITKVQRLFQEMGIGPVCRFSDIPPAIHEEPIEIRYTGRVDRSKVMSREELVRCMKKTSIPMLIKEEVHAIKIWDLIEKGVFRGITVEISHSAKKISMGFDPKELKLVISMPETKDFNSWTGYCQTVVSLSGEEDFIFQTDVYNHFLASAKKRNQEVIAKANECIEGQDMGKAIRIIQEKLRETPHHFELSFYLASLYMRKEEYAKALDVLHDALRDHRLYLGGNRELLLSFIDGVISILFATNSPSFVTDGIYLGRTAKKQFERHLLEIEQRIRKIEGDIERFSKMTETGHPQSLNTETIKLQIKLLREEIKNLRQEEDRVKELYHNISKKVAFRSSVYLQGLEWLVDNTNIEGWGFAYPLAKMWVFFAGGEPLTEDEINTVLGNFRKMQEKEPLNTINLASWGITLYKLWKYKYPERREYLEEAEKRCEQYSALLPIDEEHIPHVYCVLGLIKYELGKPEDAYGYLNYFLQFMSKIGISGPDYSIEAYELRERLSKEMAGRKLLEKEKSKPSVSALTDFIDNYLEPFIKTRMEGLSERQKTAVSSIYLNFLRRSNQAEKAFARGREWVSNLPLNMDLIMELVMSGVILDRDGEVLEITQTKFASLKEKDFLLELIQAALLAESKKFIPALKILNSLIQEYNTRQLEFPDDLKRKVLLNLFNLRADIYMEIGQFARSKKDLQYIEKNRIGNAGACRHYVNVVEAEENLCNLQTTGIFEKIGAVYDEETAVRELDTILSKHPHYPLALNLKHTILLGAGRFEEVKRAYLSLLEIYPDDLEFWGDLFSFSIKAQYSGALEYCEGYLNAGGDIKSIRGEMGSACFLAGKFQEAVMHFNAYIYTIPPDTDGKMAVPFNICLQLLASYMKMERWHDVYSVLDEYFSEENADDKKEKDARTQVAMACVVCGLSMLLIDPPDWEKIERLKGIAIAWSRGLAMDEDLRKLDEEIEFRKLELEEKIAGEERERTIAERKKNLGLAMKRINRKINELRNEVIEEDKLKILEGDIRRLIEQAEPEASELNETQIRENINKIKSELPDYLKTARERIRIRSERITNLAGRIKESTEDLLSGKDFPRDEIEKLFTEARALKVHDREDVSLLLADLKEAREIQDNILRKRAEEEGLQRLNRGFDTVEEQVLSLIGQLEDLAPGEKPEPILYEYRRIICDFFGIRDFKELRQFFLERDFPEKFVERVLKIENSFMGKYGQAKGRRKLKAREAFYAEIEDAIEEMDAIPVVFDGSYEKVRDILMRPIMRVLNKYEKLPDFEIKPAVRRRIIRRAKAKIALIIRRLREESELKRIEEAGLREEKEQKEIEGFFDRQEGKPEEPEKERALTGRQRAIQEVIDEWSKVIREELKIKRRGDVDFRLIRIKGKQLAESLQKRGIFLTYEEAFGIQREIMRVFNPISKRGARFALRKIYPVLNAISMSEKDRPRAKKEVDECFKRPEIEQIDEEIYTILRNNNPPQEIMEYMKSPASGVKRILDPGMKLPRDLVARFWLYWQTANEKSLRPNRWSSRLGSAEELSKHKIGPEEVIKVQIHILRRIYTEDPGNHLDPESPDYAVKVAGVIARTFSGKGAMGENLEYPNEFLFNLEQARLKLVPRHPVSTAAGQELSWIAKILGMHRLLTPDETRNLILLAQKGNPEAMDVLKMAHAETILTEATRYARGMNKLDELMEYFDEGTIGFPNGVFAFGRNVPDEERIRYFGLHIINRNFLTFLRLPIRNAIERSDEERQGDVRETISFKADKALLRRTRRQVYSDLDKVKNLSGLIEGDEPRPFLPGRNAEEQKGRGELTPEIIIKISSNTGLNPLEVLSLLVDCPVSELSDIVLKELAKRLKIEGESPKSLKAIARFAGMSTIDELIKNLNAEAGKRKPFTKKEIKAGMDNAFEILVKEKNMVWRKRKKDSFIPYARILLGCAVSREALGKIWWIERRLESDLKDRDLDGVFIEYLRMVHKLNLDCRNPSNTDIAPIVEYITLIPVKRQFQLDAAGVRGIESMDAPFSEDDDKSRGDKRDLSYFAGQKGPEEMLIEAERRVDIDITRLDREQFDVLRQRILTVLNKIEEMRMGERKRELLELQPIWEEAFRKLEESRALIKEIEEKLERARSEKTAGLGDIASRRKQIIDRHNEDLKRLLARQKEEMRRLLKKHSAQIEEARDGSILSTEERRVHWHRLRKEVADYIGAKKREIERDFKTVVNEIENEIEQKRIIENKKHYDAMTESDREIVQLKARHENEIISAKRQSLLRTQPKGKITIKYPKFADNLNRSEWNTVKLSDFDKFWRFILSKMDLPSDVLLSELEKECPPEFCKFSRVLMEKGRSFNLSPVELICTVFVPLTFDERVWELIDSSGLEPRVINIRLNLIIQGNRPEFNEFYNKKYGKAEAKIFFEQIRILILINEKYKASLERKEETEPESPGGIEALRERHKKELQDKERETAERKQGEDIRHGDELKRIEDRKAAAISESEKRCSEALVALERENEESLAEIRAAHKEWKERSREEETAAQQKREAARLERKHMEERDALESDYKEILAPIDREYDIAFSELEQRIGRGLDELAEAIREAVEEERKIEPSAIRKDELARMRQRLFNSERYLTQWLTEEKISLGELEREFDSLNQHYQTLHGLSKNWERAKSMYLDHIGLSLKALEARHPMTLDDIGKDPDYAKEDGTSISRERVRQILERIQVELLLFDDLDNDNILWRFNIPRIELLKILSEIFKALRDEDSEEAVNIHLDNLRDFVLKNRAIGVDTYRITACVAEQIIDQMNIDEDTIMRFGKEMGKTRIKLLASKQMSSLDLKPKPYSINGVKKMEGHFSEDYNPEEECAHIRTSGKNWLSRDEIICLGLTWYYNPELKWRVVALLDKFIEEQDDMYPNSGVLDIVVGLLEEAEKTTSSTGVAEALKRKSHGDLDYETVLKPAIEKASDEKRYIKADRDMILEIFGTIHAEEMQYVIDLTVSGELFLIVPEPGTKGLAYNANGIQAGLVISEDIGDFKAGSILLDWGIIDELLKIKRITDYPEIEENAVLQILAELLHEMMEHAGRSHNKAERLETAVCGEKKLDLGNTGPNSNSRLDDTLYVMRQLIGLAEGVAELRSAPKDTGVSSLRSALGTQIVISLGDWNELYIFNSRNEIIKTIPLKDYIKQDVLELFKAPLMIHIDTRDASIDAVKEAIISGLNIAIFYAVMGKGIPPYLSMTSEVKGIQQSVVTSIAEVQPRIFIPAIHVLPKSIEKKSLVKGTRHAVDAMRLENNVSEMAKESERLGFIQIDSALLNGASPEFLDLLYLYLVKVKKEDRIAVEIIGTLSVSDPRLTALLDDLSRKAITDPRFKRLGRNKNNTFVISSSERDGNATLIQVQTERNGNYHVINAMTIARGVIFAGGIKKVDLEFVEAVRSLYTGIFGNDYKGKPVSKMELLELLNIILPPMNKAESESFYSVYSGMYAIQTAA